MEFTSMNFGDLLFALNCDPLKYEIRKIEKINKRIVQTINGIYLLVTSYIECGLPQTEAEAEDGSDLFVTGSRNTVTEVQS